MDRGFCRDRCPAIPCVLLSLGGRIRCDRSGAHPGSLCEGQTRAVLSPVLSAHGLPERTVARGDPYRWQAERSAAAIVDALGIPDLDWSICYQSRVGPLKWIGPATDAEIRRAGAEGKAMIVAPIAFVSEHSETLDELDMEYGKLAHESGVPDYLRVPTVGTRPEFIGALADLVERAVRGRSPATCGEARICPMNLTRCGFSNGGT